MVAGADGTKIVYSIGMKQEMSATSDKSILVVEDDPTYLHLWERLIKDLGVKHFWAAKTPQKASEILKAKPIHILISDVMLPGINGYELAKRARTKNPAIEILLTTGYQTDLSRFDLAGLRCHLLHKPYQDLNDVCRLVKNLISGHNIFNEMDEDSFSENEDHPEITEWTL